MASVPVTKSTNCHFFGNEKSFPWMFQSLETNTKLKFVLSDNFFSYYNNVYVTVVSIIILFLPSQLIYSHGIPRNEEITLYYDNDGRRCITAHMLHFSIAIYWRSIVFLQKEKQWRILINIVMAFP